MKPQGKKEDNPREAHGKLKKCHRKVRRKQKSSKTKTTENLTRKVKGKLKEN